MKTECTRKSEISENINYTDEQLQRTVSGVYNCLIKRVIDFIIAIIAIIILSPIFLIISLIIIIDSGFPVLYRAPRGGYRNKTFQICKFRSMVKNADKIGGYTTALHDPRITRIGRFLRKTKLDEIPQLFNIITGEMSFVGPRPEVLAYTKLFEGQERFILQVRPGITDYSSLKFADMDATVGDVDVDKFFVENILQQKNKLRVKYVADISFVTDTKIFFKTFVHVFAHFFKKRDS
jgi:lipopolysaccharide/colanic/teichoic acid biosynthesis glycosyltransferase